MFKLHVRLGVCAMVAAFGALHAAPASRLAAADMKGDELVCRYTFADPVIVRASDGDRVRVTDAEDVSAPGAPLLPFYVARILIPAGRRFQDLRVEPLDTRELDGILRIPPAATPVPLSRPNLAQPPKPDPAIYGSDDLFPAATGERVSTLTKHGRSIVLVRLNPIQYRPQSGRAMFTSAFTVTVTLQPLASRKGAAAVRAPPTRSRSSDRDDLALSVDNAGQLDTPAPDATATATASALALAPAPLSAVLPPGNIDYVIITDTNLLSTTPPFDFAALCAARRAQGLNATNVTLDWIAANYGGLRPDGGTDTPTRIRAFIADAYATWGVRYVLLGGNVEHVPTRQCYVDSLAADPYHPGHNYACNMPVDMYYGCLDGTFDGNHNGVYGEPNDGEGGGDVDLSAEVYIGRLSVANTQEVASAIRKILLYEAQPAAALTNICMVGLWLGFGGVADYATAAMEQIRMGGVYDGYRTTGFMNAASSNAWNTSGTLYEENGSFIDWHSLPALANSRPIHVFNHLGHAGEVLTFGNRGSVYMFTRDLPAFTNATPFFVYSQGCDSGWFDAPGCFAEEITTMGAGAFAVIMNARYGWGYEYNTDGPSQRFNRTFWDESLTARAAEMGRMNQLSKERWLGDIDSACMRWSYYEITLFGDPATAFARPIVGGPPQIAHTPLENTTNSVDGYVVEAVIQPGSTLDTNSPAVFWTTNGPAGPFATVAMTRVEGSLFRATLPPQPLGATLHYWIRAQTLSGLASTAPATAPVDSYVFQIVPPCHLFVLGSPEEVGVTTPDYGISVLASGVTVRAQAPALVAIAAGQRWACRGWIGAGSVPDDGAGTSMVFTIIGNSLIAWQWQRQYALTQTATIAGIVNTSTWWDAGATGVTVAAVDRCVVAGTNYAFVEWQWNGARYPNATDTAPPTASGVLATGPCGALAIYLPVAQTSGTNGLPDWWQRRFFGALGVDAVADSDDDGFTNMEEYRDGTDPRDPLSWPTGPDLLHAPLGNPQPHPAPWVVSAEITDYSGVANATLQWRRVPQTGWHNVAMTAAPSSDVYTAEIPAPGLFGYTFEYKLSATDSNDYTSETAVYSFFVAYPISGVTPGAITNVLLAPGAITNGWLAITNGGNTSLVWRITLTPGNRFDDVESGANGCSHSGAGDNWHIATNRAWSGAHAWYCGRDVTRLYASSMHATLQLPAVALFTNASFSFRHWIASELDNNAPDTWCFDGGIVEISTNAGVGYRTLTPVGGYPYRITGWTYSPWIDGTPCFAGDGQGWTNAIFDLSAYGNQTVILRLHFGSDDNSEREGWYADDFTITPAAPAETWFRPAATNGILPAAGVTNLAIVFTATNMLTGNRAATLWLTNNCPFTPIRAIPLALQVRSPAHVIIVGAAQTTTNGQGGITISNCVNGFDGNTGGLEMLFSTNCGASWAVFPILQAAATIGSPVVSNGAPLPIAAVASGGPGVTNTVTVRLGTTSVLPLAICTDTLVRVRFWDGLYWSPSVTGLPFMVDNEPPSASLAGVHVTHSAFGDYTVGATLTAVWSNFTDRGSGLDGYYLAATNGAGAPYGQWCAGNRGSVNAVALNATNTVYVWARDRMGNCGAAVSAAVLALDLGGDADMDGSINSDEEMAGTDARNRARSFRFTSAAPSFIGDETGLVYTLTWDSAVGRLYSINAVSNLPASIWFPLTTNLSGTGGTLSYTDRVDNVVRRFYRLQVTAP